MFVLDSHCDTPSQILRLRNLAIDNDHAHVDFPKLKRGGVDGAFFALYIPASMEASEAKEYAGKLLDGVHDVLKANSDKARLALSAEDGYKNQSEGLFSIFLGLENGSPVTSLDELRGYYDAGVRYMTLCHSADNHICDSCASAVKKWHGLSPFGKEVVAEMNRLGMLVDVSHVSDETFYDVIRYSSKPVVATHSCCRALADHPRNLTDDMIRTLADAGGVVQINFYPIFLDDGFGRILEESGIMKRGEEAEREFIASPYDSEKRSAWNKIQDELQALERPSFTRIADHIDHVVSLAGIDHVGIGSDFDGIEITPSGLEDISLLPKLFDELRKRGYSESDISKVAGLNFFRIMNA